MKKPILVFYLLALIAMSVSTSVRAQQSTTDQIVLSDLTELSSDIYYFDVSLNGLESRIYSAYNMDIILPEGIDVVKSGDDYVVMMMTPSLYPYTVNILNNSQTYTHTVSASMPAEHQLRIACTSNSNNEFTAYSGTLFRVAVTLDASKFTFSPKPIVKVSGIALVQANNTKYVPADFSCRPFTTGIPTARNLSINISSTNKVGTLILPFDAALPTGVQAFTCSTVNTMEQTINLEEANSFVACKPYIVYAENGFSGTLSGTVDLSANYPDEDVYTEEEGLLTGVLTTTVVNTGYIMQNQGDGPAFYSADGENFSLPAGRCYMTLPSSGIKMFSLNFDSKEETMKIDSLSKEERSEGEAESWYTLQGVKLDQKPTEKGVYFYGQQKVLIQ